ncbi:MAG: secA, partial [Candidatus Saccharibacteria bacterium]|nr:secA [Candidatus Saccharibacteria bacterium]
MVNRQSVLTKIFGDPQKRLLKALEKRVAPINALAEKYHAMSKPELKKQTEVLKKRLAKKGTKLDDLLPDAFALVREASDRVLGMRHFDVQLIGGMALHDGNVGELKTGEGKTLMATLPLYLNALEGKGVHLVTVNDYLAQRDASWNGELFDFLGMSTGVIINDASFVYDRDYDNDAHEDLRMRKLRPATRKEAYAADITYGTNNEFGFDYLRDNMVNEVDELRQRELNFAIVDEVDSILIDEARTPLIISAPAAENPESYLQFAKVASKLTPDDYVLDEKRRTVALTDDGVDKIQKMLGIKNLYSPDYIRSVYHMDQSLKAQTLFHRDKDYVVTTGGEVVIVDEHTGRLMQGRRYNEGLHQAIEAKENVPVLQESMTLATVSFQNFFRLYAKLAGMTGTAFTEAEEFQQIYSLDVIQVPPNKPITRVDSEDLIFKTEGGKLKAVADAIKEYHKVGRPVLVGSASIAKNELIANYLKKEGIKYEILNAKNNEREAAIIEKAGEKGAITLATNIAGRGTDIKLGAGVKDLGGLVVIGSERHESRRIDNQLRGR